MPHITIISPFFNEESSVSLFFDAVYAVSCSLRSRGHTVDFIFVDDGSTDGTLDALQTLARQHSGVTVLSLSRNFGHQIALTAGIDHANADAAILLDSDLQHPPELIPVLVDRWENGYKIVQTIRNHTEDASLLKSLTSSLFYRVFNFFSDTPIQMHAADFCLIDRSVISALQSMPERHRFLRGMLAWMGYPRTYVQYTAPPRIAGQSKYTFRKMLRLATDALFSFSSRPARLASHVGLSLALAGILYLAYVVIGYTFALPFVHGWASLISTQLILHGITLFILGIHGQYISRIYEEDKRRPLYFIQHALHRYGETPHDTQK
ncbi:glycosyltransferase family 2 protein [Thermostilla marina]